VLAALPPGAAPPAIAPAFPPEGRPAPVVPPVPPPAQPPAVEAPEPEPAPPEPEPEPEPVDPEVLRRDRERKKRLQAPITRALLSDNALFAEVSRARGAAEVEEDELLAADDDGAAADVGEAADDGDDDMYGDLGGGDDDMYGDLGGDDDAGGAMVEEEAIDQNAAELPVVQALGQLEAHSSRRPRRAELAGRAAHRAYLLEALTSGA
jgi:hypothetical protein